MGGPGSGRKPAPVPPVALNLGDRGLVSIKDAALDVAEKVAAGTLDARRGDAICAALNSAIRATSTHREETELVRLEAILAEAKAIAIAADKHAADAAHHREGGDVDVQDDEESEGEVVPGYTPPNHANFYGYGKGGH